MVHNVNHNSQVLLLSITSKKPHEEDHEILDGEDREEDEILDEDDWFSVLVVGVFSCKAEEGEDTNQKSLSNKDLDEERTFASKVFLDAVVEIAH